MDGSCLMAIPINCSCKAAVIGTMASRRVLFGVLLLFGFFAWTSCLYYKFHAMTCSSSNKTISPAYSCFIKTAAGKTTMNIRANVTTPIYSLKIRYDVTHEASKENVERTVLNVTLDICSFLNGTNKDPASKWFFKLLGKSFVKGFLHPCPYFGPTKMENIVMDRKASLPFAPPGFYSSNLLFFNKDDDNILNVKIMKEAVKG